MSRVAIKLADVDLTNPVVAAAGTCGYVNELADAFDLREIGAIVSKSITRHPREGNAPWRIIPLPGAVGMLNAIGLANVGLDRFVSEKLPAADLLGTTLIGSIAGNSVEDYVAIAAAFDAQPSLPIVELNVSCPNTVDGLMFGEDPASLRGLLAEIRPILKRTKMLVKLSPNVSEITTMASAAIDGGADGLTLINTMTGMAIDVMTRETRLSNGTGGLSGPAIHPIAVRMVHEVYRDVAKAAKVPIVGLGGVMNWQDAAEMILAGATAVGVGTAIFVDPRAPVRIARGLDRWVEQLGCSNISELVGTARRPTELR